MSLFQLGQRAKKLARAVEDLQQLHQRLGPRLSARFDEVQSLLERVENNGWLKTRQDVVTVLRDRLEELRKGVKLARENRITEGRGTYSVEGRFEIVAGSEDDAVLYVSALGGLDNPGVPMDERMFKHFKPFSVRGTVAGNGRIE